MADNNKNNQIVFDNDIALYLDQFCQVNNIPNLREQSQNVWNACLTYIRRHVFPDRSVLKLHENIVNKNNICDSTYNMYNFKLLDEICDRYIYLCDLYDKEVSIVGFSNLTGIDTSVIYEWMDNKYNNNTNRLSTAGSKIYKKLSEKREESLSAKLATAKRNPVGILAILNRHYAWNLPGVSREKSEPNRIRTAEEIRQLYGDMQPPELPEPPKD